MPQLLTQALFVPISLPQSLLTIPLLTSISQLQLLPIARLESSIFLLQQLQFITSSVSIFPVELQFLLVSWLPLPVPLSTNRYFWMYLLLYFLLLSADLQEHLVVAWALLQDSNSLIKLMQPSVLRTFQLSKRPSSSSHWARFESSGHLLSIQTFYAMLLRIRCRLVLLSKTVLCKPTDQHHSLAAGSFWFYH